MKRNVAEYLPEGGQFKRYVKYNFPSMDSLYEKTYLHTFYHLHSDKENMHSEFSTLLIDTFNLSINDPVLA